MIFLRKQNVWLPLILAVGLITPAFGDRKVLLRQVGKIRHETVDKVGSNPKKPKPEKPREQQEQPQQEQEAITEVVIPNLTPIFPGIISLPEKENTPPNWDKYPSSEDFLKISSLLAKEQGREALSYLNKIHSKETALYPTSIRARAKTYESLGLKYEASCAWELWLETVGISGIDDPLEARIQEARAEFYASLGPRTAMTRREKAREQALGNDFKSAYETIQKATEYEDRDWSTDLAQTAHLYGLSLLSNDEVDQINQDLDTLKSHLSPTVVELFDSLWMIRKAEKLAQEGDWDASREHLNKAWDLTTNQQEIEDSFTWILEAEICELASRGQWEQAEELAETAETMGIDIHPLFAGCTEINTDMEEKEILALLDAGDNLNRSRCSLPQSQKKTTKLLAVLKIATSEMNTVAQEVAALKQELSSLDANLIKISKEESSTRGKIESLRSSFNEAQGAERAHKARVQQKEQQIVEAERKYKRLRDQERTNQMIGSFANVAMAASGSMDSSAMTNIARSAQAASAISKNLQSANTSAGALAYKDQLQNQLTQIQVQAPTTSPSSIEGKIRSKENELKKLSKQVEETKKKSTTVQSNLKTAEGNLVVTKENRRQAFMVKCKELPQVVIQEAIESGIYTLPEGRWDNAPELLSDLTSNPSTIIPNDPDFTLSPPQFSLTPNLMVDAIP